MHNMVKIPMSIIPLDPQSLKNPDGRTETWYYEVVDLSNLKRGVD